MGRRPQLVPAAVSALLLLGALGEHPYDYFSWLRWVVCASAALVVWVGTEVRKPGVTAPFAVLAVLFNPLIPIYLNRDSWLPIDVVAALMFLYAATIAVPEAAPVTGLALASSPVGTGVGAPPGVASRGNVAREVVGRVTPPAESEVNDPTADAVNGGNLEVEDLVELAQLLKSRGPDLPEIFRGIRLLIEESDAGRADLSYLLGLILDPDPSARDYYAQAAEAGNTDAMIAFASVEGPPDVRRGLWLEKAAREGRADAMLLLGTEMSLNPLADSKGRTWLRKAAASGDPGIAAEGMYRLGMSFLGPHWPWEDPGWLCGEDGEDDEDYFDQGWPVDIDRAIRALKRASNLGHLEATYTLAKLFLMIDPADLADSRPWIKRYLDSGGTRAMVRVAELLSEIAEPPTFRRPLGGWIRRHAWVIPVPCLRWRFCCTNKNCPAVRMPGSGCSTLPMRSMNHHLATRGRVATWRPGSRRAPRGF